MRRQQTRQESDDHERAKLCVAGGARNVRFSENFVYVLNE